MDRVAARELIELRGIKSADVAEYFIFRRSLGASTLETTENRMGRSSIVQQLAANKLESSVPLQLEHLVRCYGSRE